nr:N-6 DNA methylase [Caldisericia bacterium]
GIGGTDKVWFYDMTADGFSLDDKRQVIDENDIPDIVERFNNLEKEENRKKTEKSFFASKEDIIKNGYDLSINRYKEIEHKEAEYDAPDVILGQIEELEKEIQEGIAEIKAMIRG